jgi:hypothetical protein
MKIRVDTLNNTYVISRTVPAADGYSISDTVEEDVATLTGDELVAVVVAATSIKQVREQLEETPPPADAPADGPPDPPV